MVKQAKEIYSMKQDITISELATLARTVQRYPNEKYKASYSERTFALSTVLEQFDTGKKYQKDRTDTIAGMAGMLAISLNRRKYAKSPDGEREDAPFYEQCQTFAEKVYDFVEHHKQQRQFDARFHRFFLAAYAFQFMVGNHDKNITDSQNKD